MARKVDGQARPMNTTLSESKDATAAGYNFRVTLAEYVRSQALPADKLGHQPRLYALTRLVGEGLSYDDDVVYAAAWLHDLGVFVGHRPQDPGELAAWDNVSYAMKQAPAILQRSGFPTTKVAQVVEAIRTHQPYLSPNGIRGYDPARCGYSRAAGGGRYLTGRSEDRPGYSLPQVYGCCSHFAQKPGRVAA